MNYLSDTKGSILITFALSTTAICTVIFAAINIAQINSSKTDLQIAVDHAALALASSYNTTDYAKEANKFVMANISTSNIAKNISTTTTFNSATNQCKVTASGTIANQFASAFGKSELKVSALSTSKPPMVLTSMHFIPSNAKGFYNKTVTLFGTYPNNSTPVSLWSMKYKYNWAEPDLFGGFTTMTSADSINFAGVSSIYLTMEIDPRSRLGYQRPYDTVSTNLEAPQLLQYIKRDGVKLTQPVDLMAATGCNVAHNYNWEDGGDFDYMDFTFQATGKCERSSTTEGVRLVQ